MSILEVSGLRKVYTTRFGGSQVEALRNVNFSVEEGEYVAIMGESGSGKTTLLNILAALDRPTDGSVLLDGKDLSAVREQEAAAFRREQLGFVFQEFNLLDTFTIEDNIYLPLVLAGKRYEDMRERLLPLALELGISELLKKYPYEVSGGQKQRAAVARALITNPRLILADEPTGALDSRATDELLRLFADVNRRGQTILMVTHSVKAASTAGRVLFIRDGEVYHQLYRGEDSDAAFYEKIAGTLTVLATGGRPEMKRSFYPRLAIDGMRKNRRMYGPYLAMGVLMAAICYILSALSRSDALRTLPGGDNLCMIMALGNVVLLIFSVHFPVLHKLLPHPAAQARIRPLQRPRHEQAQPCAHPHVGDAAHGSHRHCGRSVLRRAALQAH